jgi:putative membrane protein
LKNKETEVFKMMGGGMMGMGFGGSFIWIVVIAAIAIGVYFIVKSKRTEDTGDGERSETPLDIARRRYARGDISKEEYEEIRRDLS